jgi:CheY-like chemotaxis protein
MTPALTARQTVLEHHRHKVALAPSVQEGLEQLTSQTFDVVVIVAPTPDSPGQIATSRLAQAIEKIRQHDPQIGIVVLAGYVETLSLTEQSTGADVVLSKGPHESSGPTSGN